MRIDTKWSEIITRDYNDTDSYSDTPLNDNEILERMDIITIENFLRKKKLEKIKKDYER